MIYKTGMFRSWEIFVTVKNITQKNVKGTAGEELMCSARRAYVLSKLPVFSSLVYISNKIIIMKIRFPRKIT